jgi:hypothetical protein
MGVLRQQMKILATISLFDDMLLHVAALEQTAVLPTSRTCCYAHTCSQSYAH